MEYVTAGESHGPYLSAIISGFPAHVMLDQKQLQADLYQRQRGYGRGQRMKIETDHVQITSGVRFGETLGSPIGLLLANRDFAHWQEIMSIWPTAEDSAQGLMSPTRLKRSITRPRPGHADLVGGLKYHQHDLRNVLERASARETAMRVAIGSLCQQFLQAFQINTLGLVSQIGMAKLDSETLAQASQIQSASAFQKWQSRVQNNDVRTLSKTAATRMKAVIDRTQDEQTTVGGKIRVIVQGLPPGLGSFMSAKTKLDARLAEALMSINAIKGVSFGDGFAFSHQTGQQSRDLITFGDGTWQRDRNHQGGLEGGMTNGQPLIIDLVMKPIPTQPQGSPTVDILTKTPVMATVERSDVTAVPAASTIAQAMVAIVLMQAFCEMFGSDDFDRIQASYQRYCEECAHD